MILVKKYFKLSMIAATPSQHNTPTVPINKRIIATKTMAIIINKP